MLIHETWRGKSISKSVENVHLKSLFNYLGELSCYQLETNSVAFAIWKAYFFKAKKNELNENRGQWRGQN